MKNGVIASIHTDIFGRKHEKKLELKGTKGNISWDFYKKEISIYNSKIKKIKMIKKFSKDFNSNYINEIKHFISCCKNKRKQLRL